MPTGMSARKLASAVRKPSILILLCLTGCEQRFDASLTTLPHETLPVVSIITSREFDTSDAVSDGCNIVLVGGAWGTIVRVRGDAKLDSVRTQLPGYRQFPHLAKGRERHVLVWSSLPDFLGTLNLDTFVLDSLVLPQTRWGHILAGPTAQIAESSFVYAPVGGESALEKTPVGLTDFPLLEVFSKSGKSVDSLGRVDSRKGDYLPVLSARVTLGFDDDTLRVLEHATGIVTLYPVNNGLIDAEKHHKFKLQRYWVAPEIRERVIPTPWIQLNGDRVSFSSIPHATRASFGPNGLLFVVRPLKVERQPKRSWFAKSFGFRVSRRILEVYDGRVTLLKRYSLGEMAPQWLSVGEHGRIFLGGDSGQVVIAQYGTQAIEQCPALPPRIELKMKDYPEPVRRQMEQQDPLS